MSGQYEEPEGRAPAGGSGGGGQSEVSYTEPETKPAHPTPSYVDPSAAAEPDLHRASADQSGTAVFGPPQYSDAVQPPWAEQEISAPGSGAAAQPDGATDAGADGTAAQPPQGAQDQQFAGQQYPAQGYPQGGGYPQASGYPQAAGYPQAPGYPQAAAYPAGYPQAAGYAQNSGQQQAGFPQATGQQPQQQVPGQQPFPQGPAPVEDLSSAQLLRQPKRTPQSGWRKAIYLLSGKTVNLGESPADVRRRELVNRINQPLHGCYKIAMLSLKGGVGKTTTTTTLGSTFSTLRGDRVIAVDANPDRGTLSQKIPLETTATVRHLLRDAHRVRKYSDVRSYTSQGPSRLEILASEQDPAVSEAFSEEDYRRTVNMLEHFYNVVLTDCGTGLMHSAMKGVLDAADSLVIVSSSSIDGARSASATLEWLDAHGYGQLVSRSVAVINSVRPAAGKVDVDKLAAHFGSRCRAVAKIPFDPHLEEGAEVELEQLAEPTRMALLELAAVVADDFQHVPGRQG